MFLPDQQIPPFVLCLLELVLEVVSLDEDATGKRTNPVVNLNAFRGNCMLYVRGLKG
jgi:hypothetical protein